MVQRERERELYQINEKENGFRERERAREREVFSLGKNERREKRERQRERKVFSLGKMSKERESENARILVGS